MPSFLLRVDHVHPAEILAACYFSRGAMQARHRGTCNTIAFLFGNLLRHLRVVSHTPYSFKTSYLTAPSMLLLYRLVIRVNKRCHFCLVLPAGPCLCCQVAPALLSNLSEIFQPVTYRQAIWRLTHPRSSSILR